MSTALRAHSVNGRKPDVSVSAQSLPDPLSERLTGCATLLDMMASGEMPMRRVDLEVIAQLLRISARRVSQMSGERGA